MDNLLSVCAQRENSKLKYTGENGFTIADANAFVQDAAEIINVLKEAAASLNVELDAEGLSVGWVYVLIKFSRMWYIRELEKMKNNE